MDPDSSGAAAVCIALLALRTFYACCERACMEISDSRVKAFEGHKGGEGLLARLLQSPSALRHTFAAHRLINSVLFAFALSEAALKKVFADGRLTLAEQLALAAALTAAAIILLLSLGDSVPARTVRGDKAEKFAVISAPFVNFLRILLLPVTVVCTAVSKGIAMLLGADVRSGEEPVTEEEILMMVDAGNETGAIESSEKEMINNVFEFHDMTVSDVMTHRTDIVAVSTEAEITEVVYAAINSGFSRIPVYKDSVDHIEGIIYVKDLLCLVGTGTAQSASVKDFLRDAEYVPESSMCGELFHAMTAGHFQLAVAVDEYGGTAGLVTMEDLVEAIVGSIQDEYDNEAEDISEISENTYAISGNADAGDVMETLGCPLPEDSEYDTMSGFITGLLGRIPEDGETPQVRYEDILFTVILAEDMRIVRIKAVKDAPPEASRTPEKAE